MNDFEIHKDDSGRIMQVDGDKFRIKIIWATTMKAWIMQILRKNKDAEFFIFSEKLINATIHNYLFINMVKNNLSIDI